MENVKEGIISGKDLKFAVIVSRFNDFITQKLLEGAKDALIRHETKPENITIYRVPGAFEIPLAAKRIAKSGKYDAVICLGAVIRGATPHFEYVSAEATKGIAIVGLETEIPVTFGLLTTDNIEQAIERAGSKSGNKGWDAAVSAVELLNLFKEIS